LQVRLDGLTAAYTRYTILMIKVSRYELLYSLFSLPTFAFWASAFPGSPIRRDGPIEDYER